MLATLYRTVLLNLQPFTALLFWTLFPHFCKCQGKSVVVVQSMSGFTMRAVNGELTFSIAMSLLILFRSFKKKKIGN